MSNYNKLGKNMLSLTIGSFASKVLSFMFVPFYTAVLSTEEYGTADLITTTVTLLFPFFSCIICEAMMRFALEKKEDNEQVYSVGIAVWTIGFTLLLVLSPIVKMVPSLSNYWLLVVLYYFTYSLNSNIGYFIRGIEKVHIYAVSGIINTIGVITLNVLFLLYFKLGVNGYLFAYILSNFIATIYMIVASKVFRYKIHVKSLDRNLLKRMIGYAAPLIPNSASWWVSNSSDKYILVYFAGTAVNGIYSIAYKIPTIISMVTSIFATAWRISAVEEFGSESSRRFYSDVFDMYITLTICMASCLMLFNKPLSHVLYSKDFYQAWQFVPVLLLAAVVHAYCDFFGTLYTSALKTKMIFVSTSVGAVVNIVLNLLLIPRFFALGAAVATLISYITVFLIRLFDSKRIMGLYYDRINNTICTVLVFAQIIISSCSFKYELLFSLGLFLCIVIMRRKSLIKTIKMVFRKKTESNVLGG